MQRNQKSEVRSQIHEPREERVGSPSVLRSAKDLIVYGKAYQLAMRVFELTKRFPAEERYALTSQIRRSARSVCLNLREAWAKRRYAAHFVSKLTDCDGENSETDSSLVFALDCGYITADQHSELVTMSGEIGRMLGAMLRSPEKFLLSSNTDTRIYEDPFPTVDLTSDFRPLTSV